MLQADQSGLVNYTERAFHTERIVSLSTESGGPQRVAIQGGNAVNRP
ncbi:hypothetical protein QUW44_09620 [Limosilactobacillus pontis]|uniref:Uncharacterized protein n=1 Tax=Limosilactobacillus pontis TaxID=35787 RepID=A0ABT7V086_9LACO|nr:hypothetical protein [Limosilactobacillus pontis]MDM8267368.1 hypothetical protein [Limosilactobacillus pontis]HJA74255.1 hypothetical protein [Candidatus Limosilactobacillus gallistercoris]